MLWILTKRKLKCYANIMLTLLCNIFTLINNSQNLGIVRTRIDSIYYLCQNQKGIGSRPDPFGAGAYNLQSISALRRNTVW